MAAKPQEEKRSKACAAPRCRTCGVAEFRHLCGGAAPIDMAKIERKAASAGTKRSTKKKARS